MWHVNSATHTHANKHIYIVRKINERGPDRLNIELTNLILSAVEAVPTAFLTLDVFLCLADLAV